MTTTSPRILPFCPKVPATSSLAWPTAVDRGNPGISPYGIRTLFTSESAKAPRPLPSTTPIFGRMEVCTSTKRAASIMVISRFFVMEVLANEGDLLQKYPSYARRHEVGERADNHRFQSQSRQIGLPRRSKPSDAANLNCNGAQVRKSAKRKC